MPTTEQKPGQKPAEAQPAAAQVAPQDAPARATTADVVIAKERFVIEHRLVTAGQVFRADDPLVLMKPRLFGPMPLSGSPERA